MSDARKQQVGLIQRPWGVFYLKNKITGEQTSLKTRDKAEAQRLVQARNESESQPHLNQSLARNKLAHAVAWAAFAATARLVEEPWGAARGWVGSWPPPPQKLWRTSRRTRPRPQSLRRAMRLWSYVRKSMIPTGNQHSGAETQLRV